MDLIRARRSVRRYSERRIADADLLRLAEAGRWAPSASNRQPCVFVIVEDPVRIGLLRACSPGIIGRPSAVICIAVDAGRLPRGEPPSERLDALDAAVAAQNILLEAASLGIGACPVVSFSTPAVSELLGLPPGVSPVMLIPLGYPVGPNRAPERRPLTEIAHRERFGCPFQATAGGAITPGEGGPTSGGDEPARQIAPPAREGAARYSSKRPGPGADARRPSAPGGDTLAAGVLEVMVYMLTSARMLVGEPREYGPLRLIEGAKRLGEFLVASGQASPGVVALVDEIVRAEDKLDSEALIAELLEDMIEAATGEACQGLSPRGSPRSRPCRER